MSVAFGIALLAAILAAAAAVIYLELRHVLLTVSIPAAALMLSAAAFWLAGIHLAVVHALNVLVCSSLAGLLCASRLTGLVCSGMPAKQAAATARVEIARGGTPVLAAILLSSLALTVLPHSPLGVAAACGAMLLAFGLALATSWLAAALPFSEDFIARANRLRERRERAMAALGFVTETRWALSLTGIAIVFATLAGFGVRDLHFYRDARFQMTVYFPVLPLCAFAGFLVATFDWRASLAATLALLLSGFIALWAYAGGGEMFGGSTALWFTVTLAILAVPLAPIAAASSGLGEPGDMVMHALRRWGTVAVSANLVAALLWLPFPLFGRRHAWPVVMAVAAIPAPLVFAALTVALHALLPRYRSVDEVFGRK